MSPKSFLHLHWWQEVTRDLEEESRKEDDPKEIEAIELDAKKRANGEVVPEGDEPLHETLFWMNI